MPHPAREACFFFTQYQLDPEVAKRKVTKTDEDSEKHLTEVEPGWWTKEQIAETKGILPTCENFKALADASIAGLQERPHEDNNLAALGVKQYCYTKVKNIVLGEKKRKLTAEETVEDLELGDFNAMREALHGGFQAKTIGGSKPGQEMALEEHFPSKKLPRSSPRKKLTSLVERRSKQPSTQWWLR